MNSSLFLCVIRYCSNKGSDDARSAEWVHHVHASYHPALERLLVCVIRLTKVCFEMGPIQTACRPESSLV